MVADSGSGEAALEELVGMLRCLTGKARGGLVGV